MAKIAGLIDKRDRNIFVWVSRKVSTKLEEICIKTRSEFKKASYTLHFILNINKYVENYILQRSCQYLFLVKACVKYLFWGKQRYAGSSHQ